MIERLRLQTRDLQELRNSAPPLKTTEKICSFTVFHNISFEYEYFIKVTRRCEKASVNRRVCAVCVLLCVNKWITWGYLMLLYLSRTVWQSELV